MIVYSPEQEEAFFERIDQVYTLSADGQTPAAEQLLLEIYAALPEPKTSCSVGEIMLGCIYSFYEQTGQTEKALPYLLKEVTLLQAAGRPSADQAELYIYTGAVYYAMAALDDARQYFQLALKTVKRAAFNDFNPDFLYMALLDEADFAAFKAAFVPGDGTQEELSGEQMDWITEYCEQGNLEMDKGDFGQAAYLFAQAYAVLPEPQESWDPAGWISASWGDALFASGNYQEALVHLKVAEECYRGDAPNPFVLLRLGSAYVETGERERGLNMLLKAYRIAGEELFEEDGKYLELLRKNRSL